MIFESVIGQPQVTELLKAALHKNVLPKLLLFTGISGNGKTLTTNLLAKELKSSNDLKRVSVLNSASVNQVADLAFYAFDDPYRIIVIDATKASDTSMSALASVVRSAPANVVLVVHTSGVVTPQLANLGLTLDFRRVLPQLVLPLVRDKHSGYSDKLLLAVILESTSIKECFTILQSMANLGIHTLEEFQKDFGKYNAGFLSLQALQANNIDVVSDLLIGSEAHRLNAFYEMQSVIGDVIAIKSSVKPQCLTFQINERTELANLLTVPQMTSALKILWASSKRVVESTDRTTDLLIVAGLIDKVWNAGKAKVKLTPTEKSIIATETDVSKPLSFEQLQQMAEALTD